MGAALLCGDGRVYTGCNIENSAYTPSNCAERTAFFKAVSEGVRDFQAIAVVGGREKAEEECPPCGVCRQVMAEFCSGNFMILLGREGKDLQWRAFTLDQLLPLSFHCSFYGAAALRITVADVSCRLPGQFFCCLVRKGCDIM